MLRKNKPNQDADGVSRNNSKQIHPREIPKEKDGATNPWQALNILKQEYNQVIEENKRQVKQNNKNIMKYVILFI